MAMTPEQYEAAVAGRSTKPAKAKKAAPTNKDAGRAPSNKSKVSK